MPFYRARKGTWREREKRKQILKVSKDPEKVSHNPDFLSRDPKKVSQEPKQLLKLVFLVKLILRQE